MTATFRPLLCLDFDGVIHSYTSGWKGAGAATDPPVNGIGEFLLKAVQCFRVAIYSSRSKSLLGRSAMKNYIREILWNECLSNTDEMHRAWEATQGVPREYIPWTVYDVREVSDHILNSIEWPWFKPAATITIDDRAICFQGNWAAEELSIDNLLKFKPWNKL